MKKEYTKPEIDAKAYAQFENVFTTCNKNRNSTGNNTSIDHCISIPGHPGDTEFNAEYGGNESIY